MFLGLHLLSVLLLFVTLYLDQGRAATGDDTSTEEVSGGINFRAFKSDDSSICTTPENKEGTCIAVQECKALYDQLIYHGRDPTVQKFLQKSQCGRRALPPYVCCPKSVSTPDFAECGKTSVETSTKIVGGQPAVLGSWPWIVAIYCGNAKSGRKRFQCGGSLISNRWVVTAGHCLTCAQNMKLSHVRLGDLDLNDSVADGATPVEINVQEIIPHPRYKGQPIENDIALLRLSNPVVFTDFIRPICLMSGLESKSETYYYKKKPMIAGWGAVSYRNISSSHLLETNVNVVNFSKCVQDYAQLKNQAVIDKRVICAGDEKQDSCQGDSGGPLVFANSTTKSYYLGGIVSFGVGCAYKYPGVYTKIAEFVDWINQITGLTF